MKYIFLFIYTLSICFNCYCQDTLAVNSISTGSLPTRFLKAATKLDADSAYMKNEYIVAIEIYEDLLQQGEASEMYYNLGNSYYKTGDIAKAILNYERALLLEPGNEDIRANLEIARSKTIDKIGVVPEVFFISWIKTLINAITINAWAKWGILFFILFLFSFYIFMFSKQILRKKIGFISSIACLLFVICTNLFALHQKNVLTTRNTAIVISPSVTIRSTPNEKGTSLFVLHEGSKVSIKDDSMKNWKEISLEDGKVGWISSADIEII